MTSALGSTPAAKSLPPLSLETGAALNLPDEVDMGSAPRALLRTPVMMTLKW